MKEIKNEILTGKTVLEIGTGRGGTTRELAKLLVKYPQSRLITTDIEDNNFDSLKKEFKNYASIEFIKTDASKLENIMDNSIDFIVCNYTLCAINSNPGTETIALKRIFEVLKDGGVLYIDEEFPITRAANPKQEIWAKKWRILKAVLNLLGVGTFNEIEPNVLQKILSMIGFSQLEWEPGYHVIEGSDSLEFFQHRLKKFLDLITNEKLGQGINEMASDLQKEMENVGGMEIPIYKFRAVK